MASNRRGGPPGGLGRAIRYLGHQRRTTALAYGALIIATLAQLAVPQLVQYMIESITPSIPTSTALQPIGAAALTPETLLFNAALLIALFALVRGICSFVQAFMAEQTSQGLAFDLRNEIFAKVQRLSFSYYDRNQTGQLMIRATDDVEKVRMFIAQGLVLATQALLLLVGALLILFMTNWALTLIILPLLPLALMIFLMFGRVVQPLFGQVQMRLSALNTILQENLAGIKIVKAFVREPHEEQRFERSASELMEQQLHVSRVFSGMFPLIFLMIQIGQAAILYFGGVQIINGTLNLGEYQTFSLYLLYVFFPLGQLGFIISLMAQAAISAGRIFEILDTTNEISDKPNAIALPPIRGQVEFQAVTFRYFESGEPVLQQVSFIAQPGQTIALLGATGSGKSSIINLIPRFYDTSSGAVLIDNHDVRDVALDSLRSQIGIVLQEANLFSGSIRDNIAFGKPDATFEQIRAAAAAAAAHSFIMSFPDGYDTIVGERGATLSGGQKQRIAIARALLLDPRLLILDDSTSSVDLETEYHIQQALDQLMKGRTSFVIAQRISTVLHADQILVLEKGRIAAQGTHAELMEQSPVYAEIYHSQLVDDAIPVSAPAAAQEEYPNDAGRP